MEPESLLPQEQNPSKGPHTEPDEFRTHQSTNSIFKINMRLNIETFILL
jgi:hypothetical protein